MVPAAPHTAKQRPVELNRLMRELTHDMNANFMVLRDSFEQLKQQVDENPMPQLTAGAAHVEACLLESKRLLDDLASLAKTGSVHMEPERVELSEIVAETLFEQDELLKQRGIVVSVDNGLPAVSCNRKRVKQVITNLLRNAAIHGCDSEVPRVTIRTEPATLGRVPVVKMMVHDNGPGIPQTAAEEVFAPGARLGRSRNDGTGMGLAIVRRIAEHYGGSSFVDLDTDGGTTIVVTLPLFLFN